MTAEEIRNHGPNEKGCEHRNNRDDYYWLREIAAQLAEMNANSEKDRVTRVAGTAGGAHGLLDEIGASPGITIYDRVVALRDELKMLREQHSIGRT